MKGCKLIRVYLIEITFFAIFVLLLTNKHFKMKYFRLLFCLVLAFSLSVTNLKAEKKDKKQIYAVAVSVSFQKPTVFYTDIQVLEGGVLNKGLLKGRERYSYQFKDFLELDKNEPHQTCAIYFSTNKGKLEKRLSSVLRKYKKDKTYTVIPVSSNEFTFKNPFTSEVITEEN